MYSVSQTGTFDAAHYIKNENAPDYYNQVHGHSFVVTVTCSAEEPGEEGWIVDLGQLKSAVDDVMAMLDHRMLNDIEGLERPTFERLMKWIFDAMCAQGITPSKVEIARPTLGQSGSYTP